MDRLQLESSTNYNELSVHLRSVADKLDASEDSSSSSSVKLTVLVAEVGKVQKSTKYLACYIQIHLVFL